MTPIAFGSRCGGGGGLTREATSASTVDSVAQNAWAPRTAASTRALLRTERGGCSSSPSRSTRMNARTWSVVMSRGTRTSGAVRVRWPR